MVSVVTQEDLVGWRELVIQTQVESQTLAAAHREIHSIGEVERVAVDR